MKAMKKLVVGGWLVAAGLCGTAWAEPAAETDFTFDSSTGTITGYLGADDVDVEIPATIGGVTVTAIGGSAFSGKYITGITIPASVTSVGSYAFNVCGGLMAVTFAEGSQLKSIGQGAFYACEKLASVTSMAGCPLENIGSESFYATALTDITIPASVTNIGVNAFYDCEKLASVTFEEGSKLETIGKNAFNGAGLTSITLPASVTNIGNEAFRDCEKLESVTFAPDSRLESIVESAFRGSGLTSIMIPASVTKMDKAFMHCCSLTNVTFAPGSQLKIIGIQAFMECPLTGVTLPEGLTDIGMGAFGMCGELTEITIPAGVTNIGMGAFAMCSKLEEVTVLATEPPQAGELLFSKDGTAASIDSLKAIRVPAENVEDYKSATTWLPYAAYIQAMPEPAEGIRYQDWNGTELTNALCTAYTLVTPEMTTLTSGWYVVEGQVTIDRSADASPHKPGLKVDGDAHLILTDGAELVVTGAERRSGIAVDVNGATTNSLAIYGQANQTGRLTAIGVNGGAGIGGDEHDTCGAVTINGGVVTATGGVSEGGGAGIGGGGSGGDGGTVTINGGAVTAMGNLVGAAGIGGGSMGDGGAVTVNGGVVRAVSYGEYEDLAGGGGAGIGGGIGGAGGTVTINGGEVIAISYPWDGDEKRIGIICGDGIGAGPCNPMEPQLIPFGTLDLSGCEGTYHIYAGMDTNGVEVTEVAVEDFATWHTNRYVQITATKRPDVVGYYAWDEAEKRLVLRSRKDAVPVTAETETLTSGWYVVEGQVLIDRSGAGMPGLKVDGDAHLILADGAELVVTGAEKKAGIEVSVVESTVHSLAIYGQAKGTGKLTVSGGSNGGAGIGGGLIGACGAVTVNGGAVNATGRAGAGIGGGAMGAGGTVTMNGGTVTAIALTSDGVQCGGIGRGGVPPMDMPNLPDVGTLTLNDPRGRVLVGMDTTGEHVVEVPVEEFGDSGEVIGWHTNAYVRIVPSVEYFAWNETDQRLVAQTCANYKVLDEEMAAACDYTLASGWYVVSDKVEIVQPVDENRPGLMVNGDVNLILVDDVADLRVKGSGAYAGIEVGGGEARANSLAIYGQAKGTGRLTAEGTAVDAEGAAGIGGNRNEDGGTVTIHGGTVTARGTAGAAGIGGGAADSDGSSAGNGGAVTIHGGKVTATGGDGGAGIGGGGAAGNGGAVTITGGEVIAISYPISYPLDAGAAGLAYGDGIGAGALGTGSGTLDLSGCEGTYHIYAGMDTNGVEISEVQAEGFATWHTNCYVRITTTKRQEPPEVKIVSAKSARTEGEWNGSAQVVYSLKNLDTAKTYDLAVEMLADGQFAAKTNPVVNIADGVYTQEVNRTEFFGIESQVQDPAAKLTLKLIEK